MWYTGSLSAFVAAFFKLFKHHVYTFTWQVQWKLVRLKPFSGGDLSHLQLLLVRGDTLFTLHFPMYQMACTSGTAEAPSPDITWATRCLRYVSTWLLLNYSKKIVLEETKYILFWVFFFLFIILQVQSVVPPAAFGVKFHKCAQVHQQYWKNLKINAHLMNQLTWYKFIFQSCDQGEAWHWSPSVDVLSAGSQRGPCGWHQPISGGYPGLDFRISTSKIWRQGCGKRLPDICHWVVVGYVWEWGCLRRLFLARLCLHAASAVDMFILLT